MLEKISHFYLSKKTFIVAIIATMILEPVGMVMEISLGELIPFEIIAYCVLFLLLIGLAITHHKEDHILMNGIVSGILIYEFVRYVYLFSYFTGDDSFSYFRSAGFFGCFSLAVVFMAVAVVVLITYNHFTLNRSRAVNRTKIVLNQFLLFVYFFIPVIISIVSCILSFTLFEIVTYTVVFVSDASLLLVVACCELELAINRRDETALEKLVISDVKSTLWYAFSFLFSLFCMSMTIILPDSKSFVLVFGIIYTVLSLILLIYYLNRKKEPSLKLKICLNAGLIATIGFLVFFLICLVYKIFS